MHALILKYLEFFRFTSHHIHEAQIYLNVSNVKEKSFLKTWIEQPPPPHIIIIIIIISIIIIIIIIAYCPSPHPPCGDCDSDPLGRRKHIIIMIVINIIIIIIMITIIIVVVYFGHFPKWANLKLLNIKMG